MIKKIKNNLKERISNTLLSFIHDEIKKGVEEKNQYFYELLEKYEELVHSLNCLKRHCRQHIDLYKQKGLPISQAEMETCYTLILELLQDNGIPQDEDLDDEQDNE